MVIKALVIQSEVNANHQAINDVVVKSGRIGGMDMFGVQGQLEAVVEFDGFGAGLRY